MKNRQQRNRHELKKAREVKLMALAMMLMSIVLVIAYYVVSPNPKPQSATTSSKTPRQWTVPELKDFWAREAQSLIQDDLMNGHLPYPEINDRFRKLNEKIIARTGKPFHVSLSTEYHWADMRVEGSAGIDTNGVEGIELYVPAIANTFEILRAAGNFQWRQAFQTHLIIIIMHEMDHTECDDKMPEHIDINEESRAWADTCRYTITPLFETYKQTFSESEYEFYRAWKLANGDANSIHWLHAVRKRYSALEGKAPPK